MRRAWPLGVQLNLLLLLIIVPFLGAVTYQYRSDVAQALSRTCRICSLRWRAAR